MKASLVTTAWVMLLLLLLGVPLGLGAQEPEVPDRVVWDRTPIRVVLPVGSERLVHFPEHAVRAGVPEDLPLRTLSVDGTVYWRAEAPFAPVRVIVQGLEEDGGFYLLDLEARESAPAVPLAILRAGAERPAPARVRVPDEPPHQNLDYVALTRFAAQQMYAPARLRLTHPQVRPVAVPEDPIALVRGGAIEAVPLIGWRHRGLYVTVVRLQNRAHAPAVLDPRDLRGEWLTATFQHARLLPHGDEADTTAVYLLSRRPFGESLAGVR